MNKDHDILKQIINDLKIQRYDGEGRNQYFSRAIYSALSMWIKVSTLDEDIFEQASESIGVSKIHILNRCKPFIDNMIELYPELYKWFYPVDSEENPIVIIRERCYTGGELVDVGFNTDLALPKYKECIINEGVRILRGFNGRTAQRITGLAQFRILNENNSFDAEKIFKFYGLKYLSAKQQFEEYVKNINWKKTEKISSQIFNKYCSNTFSNCWEIEYKLKNNDISLYRNEFFDFGFVKKIGDSIYTSQISKYLIEQFEVRRFMYGLKDDVENSVIAKYKSYDEKKLVKLSLYNALPQREQSILLLLGWPIKNINDKLNLLFNSYIWVFVEAILKNLNIILQEVK